MTLEREVAAGKGEKAPTHRFSRPYVPSNTTRRADRSTERKVKNALAEDKKKYGEEQHQKMIKDRIKDDLMRAERLRKEEIMKGEKKIERMNRREAEGKDPSKIFSTDEEDDGIDNTVLNVVPPPTSPDPRNKEFGRPLSTDYRLRDAQWEFDASDKKRAVIWRPGSSPVKSGREGGEEGEEEEGHEMVQGEDEGEEEEVRRDHREVEREERENEKYAENMKIVYEGVEEEALAVRDMLEKTGADPDSRRELVVLAAQLIKVNKQLIGEKEEESEKKEKKHKEERGRSRSEVCSSRSRRDESSRGKGDKDKKSKKSSFRQARGAVSSASEEED